MKKCNDRTLTFLKALSLKTSLLVMLQKFCLNSATLYILWDMIKHEVFSFFGAGDGTQGLACAKQGLYHWDVCPIPKHSFTRGIAFGQRLCTVEGPLLSMLHWGPHFSRKFFLCTLFSFGPALELFTFLNKQTESMERKCICNIILWSCVQLLCQFAAVDEDDSTITASTQITFLYSLIETNFSNCSQNSQYFKQA